MSVATVFSRTQFGVNSPLITIEVHLSSGLPAFNIGGMPEIAVRESRDRVRSALINSNFDFPMRRITVNLAPADVPKQGSRFDLAIAIGILVASGDLSQQQVSHYEFIAELSLSGNLRPISDILSSLISCHNESRHLIASAENSTLLFFQPKQSMFFLNSLTQVYQHLNNSAVQSSFEYTSEFCFNEAEEAGSNHDKNSGNQALNLSDVKGQQRAKRALIIAAAGRHNLLLIGSPGSGKTMLASRVTTILPDLSLSKAMETARIYSCADEGINKKYWCRPPLRRPHHSASPAAVIGGGRMPTPGEISLAHNGVLFLDEVAEFHRSVLEHLREPLESHVVSLSRAQWKITFPADIQLLAAMNPCPCGYRFSKIKECRCTNEQVQRYRSKLSGPIMDRLDLMVYVDHVDTTDLINVEVDHSVDSEAVREKVIASHAIQFKRQGCFNSRLNNKAIERYSMMTEDAEKLLHESIDKLKLSARVYYRFLKISRTIADYEGAESIDIAHVAEAISSRKISL